MSVQFSISVPENEQKHVREQIADLSSGIILLKDNRQLILRNCKQFFDFLYRKSNRYTYAESIFIQADFVLETFDNIRETLTDADLADLAFQLTDLCAVILENADFYDDEPQDLIAKVESYFPRLTHDQQEYLRFKIGECLNGPADVKFPDSERGLSREMYEYQIMLAYIFANPEYDEQAEKIYDKILTDTPKKPELFDNLKPIYTSVKVDFGERMPEGILEMAETFRTGAEEDIFKIESFYPDSKILEWKKEPAPGKEPLFLRIYLLYNNEVCSLIYDAELTLEQRAKRRIDFGTNVFKYPYMYWLEFYDEQKKVYRHGYMVTPQAGEQYIADEDIEDFINGISGQE